MNTLHGVTMRCGAVVRPGDRLTHPDLAGSILMHPFCFQVFDATGTSDHHGSRCWGATADVTLDEFLRDVLGRRFGNAEAQAQARAQGDEIVTPEDLAAYKFVDDMLPRADGGEAYPWWHGWALREAYLAGVKAERKRCVDAIRGVLATLGASVREHTTNGDHGTALRQLVESDGALAALTAIASAPPEGTE